MIRINLDTEDTMRAPILNKPQMYKLLRQGLLGNTVNNYANLVDWRLSDEYDRHYEWGLRSIKVSDGRYRLNVPTVDVERYFFPGAMISPMVDFWATLRGQISDSGHHLEVVDPRCNGLLRDSHNAWRQGFYHHRLDFSHSAVWTVLESYLWPSDLEDLRELLDLYPDHVIEFTACSREIGNLGNRCCVIWEIRKY